MDVDTGIKIYDYQPSINKTCLELKFDCKHHFCIRFC